MKYVIFAPHVDDEVIGCYTKLLSGEVDKVYYFFDVTHERKNEAFNSAKFFGFGAEFVHSFVTANLPEIAEDVVILAPNSTDGHVDHKKINRLAKRYPNKKLYYSIDMNTKFEVLPFPIQVEKKAALQTLFPSQAKLLQDEKYHLFESYVEDDSKKMIWVTFQRKGFHYYPQAATDESLQDVSYLGNTHRHLFKFKVSIEVNHSDREIEFHQFLNWIESLYDTNILHCDRKSCEMLADDLADSIAREYQDRKLIVEVSEDGECGCTCEYYI